LNFRCGADSAPWLRTGQDCGARVENAAEFETMMRGPDAYRLARKAMDAMVRHKVWPNPVNYEIWLHYANDPASALTQEIDRIAETGEPFTESVCEGLAATYLAKARLEHIRDTGVQLSRELDTVSKAIQSARQSNQAYGVTLAGAGAELKQRADPESLSRLVDSLSDATRQAEQENKLLQKQLKESTSEVNKLKSSLAEVRRDATTDALTKLGNRKAFDMELESALKASQRSGEPMALAVFDIDHFKRFNDTWGHQTGDQVLRYVGAVIGRVGAPPCFAARYGGEEFAVIFPGHTSAAVETILSDVLQEIGSRLLRRRSTNEELGTITMSAGVAELKGRETAEELMERADAALYASKHGGRNRVTNAEKAPAVAAA